MTLAGRLMIGALGLLLIWKIVNAVRTGTMTSRGYTFDLNEQPIGFSLGLAVYTLCVLLCGWVAAGYTPESFWKFVLPH